MVESAEVKRISIFYSGKKYPVDYNTRYRSFSSGVFKGTQQLTFGSITCLFLTSEIPMTMFVLFKFFHVSPTGGALGTLIDLLLWQEQERTKQLHQLQL